MKEAPNQINEKEYSKSLEYKNYNNIVKQICRFGKMRKWGLKRSKREIRQEQNQKSCNFGKEVL